MSNQIIEFSHMSADTKWRFVEALLVLHLWPYVKRGKLQLETLPHQLLPVFNFV